MIKGVLLTCLCIKRDTIQRFYAVQRGSMTYVVVEPDASNKKPAFTVTALDSLTGQPLHTNKIACDFTFDDISYIGNYVLWTENASVLKWVSIDEPKKNNQIAIKVKKDLNHHAEKGKLIILFRTSPKHYLQPNNSAVEDLVLLATPMMLMQRHSFLLLNSKLKRMKRLLFIQLPSWSILLIMESRLRLLMTLVSR
jgi:hypothetical protein